MLVRGAASDRLRRTITVVFINRRRKRKVAATSAICNKSIFSGLDLAIGVPSYQVSGGVARITKNNNDTSSLD
jgi:hypothetical protein